MKYFKCPECKRVCKFVECNLKICAVCDKLMMVEEDGY